MTSDLTQPNRPLRIIDLMILTAAIAFMFMLFESRFAQQSNQWLHQVFKFASAIINGSFLASIIWLIMQRVRSGRFFHHPGHWILGAKLIPILGGLLFWIVLLQVLKETNDDLSNLALHWVAISHLFTAGLHLLALGVFVTACVSSEWGWRIPMALLATDCLTNVAMGVLWGVSTLQSFGGSWTYQLANNAQAGNRIVAVCAAIALGIMAIKELRKKVPRDWLHWLGLIATLALLTVLPLIEFLYVRMLNPK